MENCYSNHESAIHVSLAWIRDPRKEVFAWSWRLLILACREEGGLAFIVGRVIFSDLVALDIIFPLI
jgi:hypothetical protein